SPRSTIGQSSRSRSSTGLYDSSTSDMKRTALGPACAPLRKDSVRSSGAPNSAASGVPRGCSGDDAREWGAGGAKIGFGGCPITSTLLEQVLHEGGQGKRRAVHGRVVQAQLRTHRIQPHVRGYVVDARRLDFVGTDHPAPDDAWINGHPPDIGSHD